MKDLPEVSMGVGYDEAKGRCKVPLHIYSVADCTYNPRRVDMMLRAYQEIKARGTEESIETCADLDMAVSKLPSGLRILVNLVVDTGQTPANWREICTILAKMLGWQEE